MHVLTQHRPSLPNEFRSGARATARSVAPSVVYLALASLLLPSVALAQRARPAPAPRVERPSIDIRPGRPPAQIRPRPPRVVVPHDPHVTFLPAATATPTATPTPGIVGCCQYGGFQPVCAAPVAEDECVFSGGTFIAEAACDPVSRLCVGPPQPEPGCCQLAGAVPACFGGTELECFRAGGRYVDGSRCDATGSVCDPPASGCGNGIVEPGEECETDFDCASSAEGCTDQCLCVGGLEVWLRWTNYNDVDLEVIDPDGNVYVPREDVNDDCGSATRRPTEFLFLPPGDAPAGCYTVRAHFDHQCPRSGSVDTHLQVRLNVAGFKYTIRDVPGPQPGETFETHFGVETSCQ